MNSHEQMLIDHELDKLRSRLNEIEPPKHLKDRLFVGLESLDQKVETCKQASHTKPSFKMPAYVPLGAYAASVAVICITAYLWFGSADLAPQPQVTPPAQQSTSRINSYLYTPVKIHSLTRGPQIRYQRSRVVQTHTQVAKISYLPIQRQE